MKNGRRVRYKTPVSTSASAFPMMAGGRVDLQYIVLMNI